MDLNLLTVKQTTALIPESNKQSVCRMIRTKVIPEDCVVRLGRRLFVRGDRLKAWIEAGGTRLEDGWRGKPMGTALETR